jgi:phosphoribosylformylglycinamidine cyclo-ligase
MTTYVDAGVNIDDGNSFGRLIKKRVRKAWPEMADEIGGFAGGGPIPSNAVRVVGSTDGTGTVALLAALVKKYDTIGFNAVAMGAVDTYIAGAKPAYLWDTLNVGHLVIEEHIQIIDSIIAACKTAGCKLSGGETAEIPDMHRYPWVFNLDVAVVGFPSPDLTYMPVCPGQKLYGWMSFGPGSNGFSLLRKVHDLKIKEDFWFHIRQAFGLKNKSIDRVIENMQKPRAELYGQSLTDVLLVPTPIWIPEIEAQRKRGVKFSGHAHITGEGMPGNIPRILPSNCMVVIDRNAWKRPAIFRYTQDIGKINQSEMDRTFNQGIMVVSIVDLSGALPNHPNCIEIGEVQNCSGCLAQVVFTGRHLEE